MIRFRSKIKLSTQTFLYLGTISFRAYLSSELPFLNPGDCNKVGSHQGCDIFNRRQSRVGENPSRSKTIQLHYQTRADLVSAILGKFPL
jgi:hypothetical protein